MIVFSPLLIFRINPFRVRLIEDRKASRQSERPSTKCKPNMAIVTGVRLLVFLDDSSRTWAKNTPDGVMNNTIACVQARLH